MRARTVLVAAFLTLGACAGSRASQGQAGAAAAGAAHPQVDTGLDTCAGCHAQVTPGIEAAWRDGRHGMALVECVVCHGSTGSDFRARPQPTGCGGCHAAEVASVTRAGATPGCFGCHPAHALHAHGRTSPHGPKEAQP